MDTDSPRERSLRLRSILQRLREADLRRTERLDPPAACDLQVHCGGVARPLIGWFGGRGRGWRVALVLKQVRVTRWPRRPGNVSADDLAAAGAFVQLWVGPGVCFLRMQT